MYNLSGNSTTEAELKILEFWAKNQIYKKSVKQNANGKTFYLMDGPPYATGHIHMGTALNKISKDIAMRSHRLQGFDVFDRAGYDTHGVPIEYQIEKEIGSKSKQDIETYGVKKFVEKCKDFATRYIDVMNQEFRNLGVWMNFENPYLTLTDDYIEAIWDTFKEADKKKLLYLGKYPIHICPRCATAVAFNEIEYAKQEDLSVFVKFPLKDRKNTFLIIWTTTPWTLPGNTGVMAHPDFVYQEIEVSDGERWIMAKELVPKIMDELGDKYTEVKEFKGKTMEGWKYENPLAKNLKLKLKNAYKVVLSGRYVNLEEGTGLVHSAPGHGKEDYEVGREYGLDMPSLVDITGNMTAEAGKYSGKKARVVDTEIIEDLESEGFLVLKKKYVHDYPLCWRCKSPLLMVSQPQWFLKISSIQKKLLEDNQQTCWIPDWMKARMKAWLEGISDWPISRKRYWGTPLPIWLCSKCEKKVVVGSIDELKKLSGAGKIDMHKPEIDKIEIPCSCGGMMERVPDVLDVWFDSGVSSWAALGFPSSKENWEKFWPADLNLEGKDQIRGWWNSQMILSEIRFGKKPFKNIFVHGMVLDVAKRKMSKSVGNIIAPADVIQKFGRDYLRYYFAKVSKGEDFAFDENEFVEIKKVLMILANVNNFVNQLGKGKGKQEIEDKWILSRLNSMVKQVTDAYNSFKHADAVQALEKFIVSDLSRTYIQMIRERSDEVSELLGEIRLALLKLLAPIIPFSTEKIWQELREKKIVKEESIHLSDWPKFNEKMIDENFELQFKSLMELIEIGLAERDKLKIGVRWPLKEVVIRTSYIFDFKIEEIIKNKLNVKEIKFEHDMNEPSFCVKFDTKMTDELEAEGFAREISRAVQAERKKKGLVKDDKIKLSVAVSKGLIKKLEKMTGIIKERTNSKSVSFTTEKLHGTALKVKDEDVEIVFERI